MKFSTTVYAGQGSANTTGIVVPPEVVDGLGGNKRPAVNVNVNGFEYRSTVASMGGLFLIPISSDIRKQTGLKAGDPIDVDLTLDTAPREFEMPPDLAEASANEPEARAFWDKLAPSAKKAHVTALTDAKTPETRARRVAKAVETLKAGKR